MSSHEEQFIEAARIGDLVTLRALLEQVDPKSQHSKALAVAAMNARLQAALVLYPLSDPEAIEHWCHLRQGTDPELILRMVEWARAGSAGPGSPANTAKPWQSLRRRSIRASWSFSISTAVLVQL